MSRIYVFTGKGGVGKSSVASAHALKSAREGKKTLLVSTDMAHNLGDIFEVPLGKEPVRIQENLDLYEIDPDYVMENDFSDLMVSLAKLLPAGMGSSMEDFGMLPGMEELFSLLKIADIHREGLYDRIFVDCAPTGETLALLKYPEQLSGFLKKVLPMKRFGAKVAGPAVEKITKVPMPAENVFDDLEQVLEKMESLQKLLLNKDVVSIRIVTTPEKIMIREARRSFTCLHLYNYNVDAVIVNRIYPKRAMEGYFSKWMELQKEGCERIAESFSEVPRFELELQPEEVRGLDSLKKIGKELFDSRDISAVLFREDIYLVEQLGDEVILHILLPFAEREELDLRQKDDELILCVKNEIRRFPLPVEARKKEIAGAKRKERYLDIIFK